MARHTLLRGRFFLHIFQQNGYKLKEFWQWLFKRWNQRVITPEHVLYNIVLALLIFFLSTAITGSTAIVILSLFGIFWFVPFNYYSNREAKKPLTFTPRMSRLTVPYVLLGLILPAGATYLAYLNSEAFFIADIYILSFGWVLGNALMPFFIFLATLITKPYENYVHRYFIKSAREKLKQMPDLTVVAITGSYGKTSTKFMIRDLLSERFSVCSTPGSYNTPMGICKVINNDLEAHHQVLVLEMGARYEGNIDALCDIVEPDIAVVTNVGIAHLETFGSQDTIARTKSTLVKRTKPNGSAVLNADDERVAAMANLRDDLDITRVGLAKGEIKASDISYSPDGMQFTATANEESALFKTPLLGAHNAQNMLLAIGVAKIFDMRLTTLSMAAARMEPVEHRLELKQQGGLTIIDDAFNSNPVGAKNAVEVLSQFSSGRRIIITPGMIELGDIQGEKNHAFGQQIGQAELDLVILVGHRQTEAILQGLKATNFDSAKIKTVSSLHEANRLIQDFAQSGDVVLYENDLPDSFDE